MVLTQLHYEVCLPSSASPNTLEILEEVRRGAVSIEVAVPLLVSEVMEDHDRSLMLALALVANDDVAAGVELLESAISQYAENETLRINLSYVWFAFGFINTARLALGSIDADGLGTVGDTGRRLERARQDKIEVLEYLELQRHAIEEARQNDGDSWVGGAAELAMNYMMISQLGPEDFNEEAAALFEEAAAREPDSSRSRAFKAQALSRAGQHELANEAIRSFERAEPYSTLSVARSKQEIADINESNAQIPLMELVDFLVVRCLNKAQGWNEAIDDLRDVFDRIVRIPSVYEQLMVAELAVGMKSNALRLAAKIAGKSNLTYVEHFNVAQVLWNDSDSQLALFHLRHAFELAADDHERSDVLTVMKNLGIQNLEG